MRVYIAGPMNAYPDGNKSKFATAANELRTMGHDPVNPHDISPLKHEGPCMGQATGQGTAHGHRYGCYMVPDIHALLDCDGYTLLSGWQRSKGASVERTVARICGKTFVAIPGGSPTESMMRGLG